MDISKRLKTIASFADEPVIADIGCDHALVCIEAVLNGKVKKAYACDLREGPLMQARANIEAQGLADQIEVRLQDGLKNLPDDTGQIIIAGMGGKLIEQILNDAPLPLSARSLLLSAHKDVKHLRHFLLDKGWSIECEWTIFDQRYYTVIKVRLPYKNDIEKQDDAILNRPSFQQDVQSANAVCQVPLNLAESQLQDKESLLLGFQPQLDQTYLDYLEYLEHKWQKIRDQMPEAAAASMDENLSLVRSRRQKLAAK